MSYIRYFVIALLVILIFYFVKLANRKSEKNMDEKHFSVRQPIIFLLVGIICTLFFSALTIYILLFPNDTAVLSVYLIFIFFSIFGILITIYCAAWKIQVDDDLIIYIPFIGIKRNISIKNITKVKMHNNQKITIYTGEKKIFSVEPTSKGHNVLVSRLKNEHILFDIDYNLLK